MIVVRPWRSPHRPGSRVAVARHVRRKYDGSMETTRLMAALFLFAVTLIGCGSDESSSETGANAKGIACGDVTCDNVCCPSNGACEADYVPCLDESGHGYYMECDGPEDCASGDVCCISVGAMALGGSGCSKASDCETTSMQQVACHGGGDCPSGTTCQPADNASMFVPTLLGCK